MPGPKCTDQEFIELWRTLRSAAEIAKAINTDARTVLGRRRRIEAKYRISLSSESRRGEHYAHLSPREHSARHLLEVKNGTVLVFSDAHFWPGVRTAAFRALLRLTAELKPAAIVNNGDAFDGASISRFPRIGWDSKPSVLDELKACEHRLTEIEDAAGRAKLIWPLGNHDSRFETRLAANAPEFQGVKGFHLKDHFPRWRPCWSLWVNDDVVIKHRYHNGIHAVRNNAAKGGKTMVTGHLHSLKVTPLTDYTGTRFGVDTGTLADPSGPQFVDYTEDAPLDWRSGFAVLTFWKGRLLWPELVHVLSPTQVEFRGQVLEV
jgi:DNA-binding CsgD family transcriptional regulator